MNCRERVLAALDGKQPDRTPLFLFGLDPKFAIEHFGGDYYAALDFLGLDTFSVRLTYWCGKIPTAAPLTMRIPDDQATGGGVFAGWNGIDEFGRVWQRGSYTGGALRTWDDLDAYTPALRLEERTPPVLVKQLRERFPDKALAPNVHWGPIGLTMESMGHLPFCIALYEDRKLIEEAIRRRTDLVVQYFRYAEEIGVDYLVLGDDVSFGRSSFISPADLRQLAEAAYRRIVEAVRIPVVWHCDGHVEGLLDFIRDCGFAGVHPIDTAGNNDLGRIKKKYGADLTLIGNVNCLNVLTGDDPDAVRADVDRCMRQAKDGGGYMLATSNSAHFGVHFPSVVEMYRYGRQAGHY